MSAWLALLIGLAIGLPAGAAWVLWRFLQLHAQMDSADMAMTIRALREKVRKQAGFIFDWQVIAALVLLAGFAGIVGLSRYQLANCRAELAEFRRAYDVLTVQVQTQAAAMSELEQKAKAAARRGAQARSEAKPVVEASQKSAEALARRMSEPPATSCPAGEGLAEVRKDLRGELK